MKPPDWWNPRLAAALLVLGAFVILVVAIVVVNAHLNRLHYGAP